MDKLKPCPFCGGSVSIAKGGNNYMYWFVTRGIDKHRCNCRLFMESDEFPANAPKSVQLRFKNELVDAWNNRADTKSAEIDFDYEAED